MDYLRASYLDNSDGASLRRFIDNESYNRDFDEDIVVVETENRSPISRTKLSGSLGREPNFMIRKRQYKLMLPKIRDSHVLDMMYDLQQGKSGWGQLRASLKSVSHVVIHTDPGEGKNLMGLNGPSASHATIGKAEHLKALLVEWMRRRDGDEKYYSDSKCHL